MSVPVLILAGGASRRMGTRDKLLELVEGAPLLRVLAQRALEVSDDVTVLVRPNTPARRQAVNGLAVNVLETDAAIEGIGGSLREGCQHLSQRDAFLLVLGDLPDITGNDMRAVLEARQAAPQNEIWRGATEDGAPGHPILFSRACFPMLLALRGDQGANAHMSKKRVALVNLSGQRARLDLDTPEAWDAWRQGQT